MNYPSNTRYRALGALGQVPAGYQPPKWTQTSTPNPNPQSFIPIVSELVEIPKPPQPTKTLFQQLTGNTSLLVGGLAALAGLAIYIKRKPEAKKSKSDVNVEVKVEPGSKVNVSKK